MALQAIDGMVGLLDRITFALGKETVDTTVSDLASTAGHLRALPQLHAGRQEAMAELAAAGNSIQDDVNAMLETLRYLRTFAVTVKITGAGAAAFSSFADEMLERIQSGRDQVDAFAELLRLMRDQVRSAVVLGRDLTTQYEGSVPGLAGALTQDAARMGAHYAAIERVSADLSELARKVQGKVARILSALQIGDMTRQRVEHVQAGLAVLDTVDAGQRAPLLDLLAAQADDLLEEFQSGCGTVTSTLGGLAADVKEIVALGRKVRGGSESDGAGVLRALEESVGSAQHLIGVIEGAGQRAGRIGTSSAETAGELIQTVGTIRAIRSDIQYMAINTSLRCSRLGDAGKPMNVVASELRVFAEQMETVSDRLLTGLNKLNDVAARARTSGEDASTSLGEGIAGALSSIKGAGARVADDLRELSMRGDEVARSVGQGVQRLDFANELGDILEECSFALAQAAADAGAAIEEGQPPADAAVVAEKIFKTYTMARERVVHRQFFPETGATEAPVAAVQDDLDAVLF